MSREDLFVMTKLFDDDDFSMGVLQHITQLPVPPAKEIVIEKKPPKEKKRPFYEPLQLNHPKYLIRYFEY